MSKNLSAKAISILIVILICLYGIFGLPKSKDELIANFHKNIKLGLDLKGGSQLVLQVQVQDAFKADADATMDRMKEEMKKGGIDYQSMDRNEPDSLQNADTIQISVKGITVNKTTEFRNLVNNTYTNWILAPVNSSDYKLTMKTTAALELRRETVKRSIDTIEHRITGLGLTEPSVQQRGRSEAEAEILVQMPGVDDPAAVKAILQTSAVLEIAEVKGGPFPSQEAALAQNGGILPLNTKVIKEMPRGGGAADSFWLISRSPVVSGRDLRNARPSRDQLGKWSASFTLSPEGGKRFAAYTGANIGNKLAVILDGQARSVATINARIEENGEITNLSSETEASNLSLILRSGSLPAGVIYLEERSVGPSLGADSIQQGIYSGLAGVLAVVVAMLIYYKKSGINATLALILNAIILIAALAYFDATLTLPGIAGVILTIGMAVDSNVLIFERIREELRGGKAVIAAVNAGFSKAFLTIIDTHVTTVVSCAFLFMFGTGAVKGFAVTLVIGLLANVFTAVFVSKAIFDWELSRGEQPTSLSI